MVRPELFKAAAVSCLIAGCSAGPLLLWIIPVIPEIASAYGCVFIAAGEGAGAFVLDPALYWGASAATVITLGVEIPVPIQQGLKAKRKKDRKKASESLKSFDSSVSVSHASAVSKSSSEWSKTRGEISSNVAAAQASAEAVGDAAMKVTDCAAGPFTSLAHCGRSSTKPKRDATPITSPSPTPAASEEADSTSPTPDSFLNAPPGQLPPGVPASVPAYNFDMCKASLRANPLGKIAVYIPKDSPASFRVDNVPSTCMVLASVLMGDPANVPHPIPMGASSLQWNNCNTTALNTLMGYFGSVSKPPNRRSLTSAIWQSASQLSSQLWA